MSIIITHISKYGIIHMSDTALSDNSGQLIEDDGIKTLKYDRISTLISFMGDFVINGEKIDYLITRFIESDKSENVEVFANNLKAHLDPFLLVKRNKILIHITGLKRISDELTIPEFYFLRNLEIDVQDGEYILSHEALKIDRQFGIEEYKKQLSNPQFKYQIYVNGFTQARVLFNQTRTKIDDFFELLYNDQYSKVKRPENLAQWGLLLTCYIDILKALLNFTSIQVIGTGKFHKETIEFPRQ